MASINLLNIKPNVVSDGIEGRHFLFYGAPSTRKTSVAACFPKALFLATEIGYKNIPGLIAQDIDSWATFLAVVKELEKPEIKKTFSTIVIDTVSILSDLCLQYTCNVNGIKDLSELGYGKGYLQYKNNFNRQIYKITQLGYSIVFIDHAEVKTTQEGVVTSIAPKLNKRTKEIIDELVDVGLYLTKEVVDGRNTVMAYSYANDLTMTKSRIRGLAPRFEFTYENLCEEIQKALHNYSNAYNQDIVLESGKKVEEKVVEPYSNIKERVVGLAKELLSDSILVDKATDVINLAMKGTPISQAPESYRQILLDLEQELLALKD